MAEAFRNKRRRHIISDKGRRVGNSSADRRSHIGISPPRPELAAASTVSPRWQGREQQQQQPQPPVPPPSTRQYQQQQRGQGLFGREEWTHESPTDHDAVARDEEDLTRNALPAFYQDKIKNPEVTRITRLAYIGTGASNLAHLVNTQSDDPDCLHYPFPHYRRPVPWKPSPDSTTPRAIPLTEPSGSPHDLLQWRFTTEPDPDIDVIPIGEIREQLVDAYFAQVHPGLPIVHEGDFRQRLAYSSDGSGGYGHAATRDEPPPLLLMQCVFLVGAHVCTSPVLAASRSSIKTALYRRARALFDIRHENDRVILVQAALLLAWHTDNADDIAGNAWYWVGIASRIATGLGMHRTVEHARMMKRGHCEFRLLWWAIVQAELPPPSRPSHANVAFFRANTSLCLIIYEVVKLHAPGVVRRLGGDDSTAMQEARNSLNASLATWSLQLPPELANRGRPAASFWAAQLDVHYHMAVLCLNRRISRQQPYAMLTGVDNMRLELCNSVATNILSCLEHIKNRGWVAQCWSSVVTAMLAAAIQFSVDAWRVLRLDNGSLPLALDALDRLVRLGPVALALAPYWPAADGVHKVIEQIQLELRSSLIASTQTGAPSGAGDNQVPPVAAGAVRGSGELNDVWDYADASGLDGGINLNLEGLLGW
ncbi:hypothetical protein F4677DRAFT_463984 [Hypoxylon crocopeplum]|nr:hypothetical protein F4677DRAFT_463984 [Hypoxylon crocopeplum]